MVSSVRPDADLVWSLPPWPCAFGSALATLTALEPFALLSVAFCSTVWVERTTLLSGSKVSLVSLEWL